MAIWETYRRQIKLDLKGRKREHVKLQSWDEHAENHERIVRHRLDEIALQHCAEGDSIPIETLETLSLAQIDYLYERIASLRKGSA